VRRELPEKAGTFEILCALSDLKERSFSELLAFGIPRANLFRRLKELEAEGYIERRIVKGVLPRTFYRITERGLELYRDLLKCRGRDLLKCRGRIMVEEYAKHFPNELREIAERYAERGPH